MQVSAVLIIVDWRRLSGLCLDHEVVGTNSHKVLSGVLPNDAPTMVNRLVSDSTKEFSKGNLQCFGNFPRIDQRRAPLARPDQSYEP